MSADTRAFTVCRTAFERFKPKVTLQESVDRGELIIDGSEAVSLEMIASELISLCAELELDQVAVDPAMMGLIAPTLEAAGIELRAARQGMMSMSPAIHLAEELISAGNLLIGDDHLMRWALGNTAMASASIGRRPVKIGDDQSVNPRKIDPVSAMLTALQLVMEQRFGENSAYVSDANQPDLVCPWTDPISARAVLEGGVPVMPVMPMADDPISPEALASALHIKEERISTRVPHFTIPFRIRRKGVEARFDTGREVPDVDMVLIRNVAKAHKWLEMLKQGQSFAEIAEEEKLSVRRVQQLMEHAFLAPDITRSLIAGKQPPGLTTEYLQRSEIPENWAEQRQLFATISD